MTPIPDAAQLAALAASIRQESAPGEVRERVLALMADTVGTAVFGSTRDDIRAARRAVVCGQGPSTVIGTAGGAAPMLAAFANGMPIAAHQLQDGHRRARGHPAAHVVPAVLAVAEAVGASGGATVSAILAGCEVGIRVGMAMGATPTAVHDIGTWGMIGAAAGVAHLVSDGDAEVIAAAIELAATQPIVPSAQPVFAGYSGGHLLLGTAVAQAVMSGQTAGAGFRAPSASLERHFARHIAADWHSERLWLVAEGKWAVLDGYIKRHPTCAHLHGVNDAVEDLLSNGSIRLADVAYVDVRTYPAAAVFDVATPRNEMEARFSIPWTVASALAFGALDERAFTAGSLANPDLISCARRVSVRGDPGLDDGYPAGRPARVTVHLTDGSILNARADVPRGDGRRALDDPGVRSKPRRLLTTCCDPTLVDALLVAIERLPGTGMAPFTDTLRAVGRHVAGREWRT